MFHENKQVRDTDKIDIILFDSLLKMFFL